MSSHELKTSKFSLVLHTRENSDVFNTLDEIYLVFTSKSKYPLCPLSFFNPFYYSYGLFHLVGYKKLWTVFQGVSLFWELMDANNIYSLVNLLP